MELSLLHPSAFQNCGWYYFIFIPANSYNYCQLPLYTSSFRRLFVDQLAFSFFLLLLFFTIQALLLRPLCGSFELPRNAAFAWWEAFAMYTLYKHTHTHERLRSRELGLGRITCVFGLKQFFVTFGNFRYFFSGWTISSYFFLLDVNSEVTVTLVSKWVCVCFFFVSILVIR